MLLIGICGASGSGKSTLAHELQTAIGKGCTIINHDSYYLDFPQSQLSRAGAAELRTNPRFSITSCFSKILPRFWRASL